MKTLGNAHPNFLEITIFFFFFKLGSCSMLFYHSLKFLRIPDCHSAALFILWSSYFVVVQPSYRKAIFRGSIQRDAFRTNWKMLSKTAVQLPAIGAGREWWACSALSPHFIDEVLGGGQEVLGVARPHPRALSLRICSFHCPSFWWNTLNKTSSRNLFSVH